MQNCATARVCSHHFHDDDYERDVQHEILGLPSRFRLKKGSIPALNLPADVLKEEKPLDSAIEVLLALGLVRTEECEEKPKEKKKPKEKEKSKEGVTGGLPQE